MLNLVIGACDWWQHETTQDWCGHWAICPLRCSKLRASEWEIKMSGRAGKLDGVAVGVHVALAEGIRGWQDIRIDWYVLRFAQ